MPFLGTPSAVRYYETNIDLSQEGEHSLLPVFAGQFWIGRMIEIWVRSMSGILLVPPIVSVGTDVGRTNIIPLSTLVLPSVNSVHRFEIAGGAVSAGDAGKIKIATPAVGAQINADVFVTVWKGS